jgi:serine/threonine-protein kinase
VERALEVSPGLPHAHLAMGDYYLWGFEDYDSALEEYAIAKQGMPGSAELYRAFGNLYRRVGEWDESVVNWERAVELDPRSINHRVQLARTYIALRNYQQAEHTIDRALEIAPDNATLYGTKVWIPVYRGGDFALFKAAIENPPMEVPKDWQADSRWLAALYDRDYATALALLDSWEFDVVPGGPWEYVPKTSMYGVTYQLAGESELAEQHFQAAREQLEAAFEANPEDPRFLNALGRVLAGLGQNEEAVSMARQAIDATSGDTFLGSNVRLDAILVFAAAGDSDAAIEELDTYLAAPGFWSIEGLLPDPRLDPIRDDPRFQALVDKYSRQ